MPTTEELTIKLTAAENTISALKASLTEVKRDLQKSSDTVAGLRGRQAEIVQERDTLQSANAALEVSISENADAISRIPGLETQARNAGRLEQLANHPNLFGNKAMRTLILSSSLGDDDLAELLEDPSLFTAASAGDPPTGDPPTGDPPTDDPPTGDPPEGDPLPKDLRAVLAGILAAGTQLPGPTGGGSGFGTARGVAEIDAAVVKAVNAGDTQGAIVLMLEKKSLLNKT